MKKLLLLTMLIFLGYSTSYGQAGFTVGVNGGIPIGDADDYSNFQLGADVAYRVGLAGMFEVGGLVGYSVYFADDQEIGGVTIETDDIQFIPVAASGRLGLTSFFVGLDLGYAIGVNDGNDGGFYYRPQVGYDLGIIGILASYSGVSTDGDNISSINLGVEFGF